MSTLISATLRYARRTFADVMVGWSGFWFQPRHSLSIGLARIGIGFWALVYVISWWQAMPRAIGRDGLFPASLTRYLVGSEAEGTGSQGRLSVLYLLDSNWSTQLYLIIAAISAVLMIAGIGGRLVAAICAILILGITHRLPMTQEVGELVVSSMMIYLIVDTGRDFCLKHVGIHDGQARSSANLALRLMQVHVLIWILVSLASMIAEEMWWNGSAVWWLTVANRSPIWSPNDLVDNPYWVNIVSHLFVLLHVILVVCLCRRGWRPWGGVAGVSLAILAYAIAGEWMYGLALVCALSVFAGDAFADIQASANGEENTAVVGAEATRIQDTELSSRKSAKREAKRAIRSR